ncbi:hypothetical protein [Pantoea agglomerans]|uniref:hypothetical protein n=1 Tax=Enterobacter agglomerans TaxID=549 RepID=UPI003C7D039B
MEMNKSFTALVFASGITASGVQADQGSGTVTFTVSVIDSPCSNAAGNDDQSVSLVPLSSAAVANGLIAGCPLPDLIFPYCKLPWLKVI